MSCENRKGSETHCGNDGHGPFKKNADSENGGQGVWKPPHSGTVRPAPACVYVLYVRACKSTGTNRQAQHKVAGKHTGQRRREAGGKRIGRDLGTHVREGIGYTW